MSDEEANEKQNNESQEPQPKKSVKLCLIDTEGNQIEYEVKRHVPLSKLLDAYCKAKGKTAHSVSMSIGGSIINTSNNANELGLDDGTKIEIVSRQHGGGFGYNF